MDITQPSTQTQHISDDRVDSDITPQIEETQKIDETQTVTVPAVSSDIEDQTQPDSAEASATDMQHTMMALQAIIERQISQLDELKKQSREFSESMKSILENDAGLHEAEQQAQEQMKQAKERKTSLTTSPEYRELRGKQVEVKDEIKELEESLNTHLLNYYNQTGVKSVDLSSGSQREFKIIARVLPQGKTNATS